MCILPQLKKKSRVLGLTGQHCPQCARLCFKFYMVSWEEGERNNDFLIFVFICNIAEENKIWKTPATDIN